VRAQASVRVLLAHQDLEQVVGPPAILTCCWYTVVSFAAFVRPSARAAESSAEKCTGWVRCGFIESALARRRCQGLRVAALQVIASVVGRSVTA
jgi:hypothetical protein